LDSGFIFKVISMNTKEKQKIINRWLKNRQQAYVSGSFKEVNRINKILAFYGYGPKESRSAA